MVNEAAYHALKAETEKQGVTLVAVSKLKPAADIKALYDLGQRDFGENYVQELVEKSHELPKDIRWHFIGHLQSNKVKYIASFVYLIHAIDSYKLLEEISKQGAKVNRVVDVLLQQCIAIEETKHGMDEGEIRACLNAYHANSLKFNNVCIRGMMGMASFIEDEEQIRAEFGTIAQTFKEVSSAYFSDADTFDTLSIGMSGDYKIAMEAGGNMVRIGSALFGARR